MKITYIARDQASNTIFPSSKVGSISSISSIPPRIDACMVIHDPFALYAASLQELPHHVHNTNRYSRAVGIMLVFSFNLTKIDWTRIGAMLCLLGVADVQLAAYASMT